MLEDVTERDYTRDNSTYLERTESGIVYGERLMWKNWKNDFRRRDEEQQAHGYSHVADMVWRVLERDDAI